MRPKILAAIFLCTVICLAQTNNQNAPAASKTQTNQTTYAACPCCKAMAHSENAKSCCQHESAAKDGKDTPACCQGKEGMSCMKDDKAKSADAASASCCGGADQKGCCTKSEKTSDKAAMACCQAAGAHCGMQQHEHADLGK